MRVRHDGRSNDGAGGRREAVADSAFLVIVVASSAIPYISGLGFYSDDWPFLAAMTSAEKRSVWGIAHALQPDLRMRPVQVLTLALLFSWFGLHPLGYHVFNTAVLAAGVVVLHLVLRRLGFSRVVTLSIALVFGLLPHYSTTRFWMAAFQIPVSMVLYLMSLYADLKWASGTAPRAWRGLAILCMVASVLAYEVFLPFFLFHPVLLFFYERKRGSLTYHQDRTAAGRSVIQLAMTLLALLPVLVFKLLNTTRLATLTLADRLDVFSWLIAGSAVVSFVDYGVALPRTVSRIVRAAMDPGAVASAGAIGTAVYVYLFWVGGRAKDMQLPRYVWAGQVVAGGMVFVLGYFIFFIAQNAQFSPAGISNRVAIGGALGVALIWVGMIGWLNSFLSTQRARLTLFAVAIACLCGIHVMIIEAIGGFWVRAYREEQLVLNRIRKQFSSLAPGTTLILDGICPYLGPAVVFDSSWDLAGALRLLYGNAEIKADVVTPNLTVEPRGLKTSQYSGTIVVEYPYEQLVIYHARLNQRFEIGHEEAARRYFATHNPDRDSGCPQGREGHGVRIF
jgi:hypothetical protein